jgi:uncharacterized membrane protein YczE
MRLWVQGPGTAMLTKDETSGTGQLARRWLQLTAGLFVYGVAMTLLIRSGLGLGPWDAFHVGLSRLTDTSVGVVIAGVGLVIIVGGLFIGVRPGPGTVANMLLIAMFVDLLLPVMPEAGPWLGIPYHLGGIVLTGVATGLYISPKLGKGPRDGLMIGIAERTGWSVKRVRTGIEFSVLLLGWLMGGRIGLGTLLFALGIGPATEWGLGLFGATSSNAGSRFGQAAASKYAPEEANAG